MSNDVICPDCKEELFKIENLKECPICGASLVVEENIDD